MVHLKIPPGVLPGPGCAGTAARWTNYGDIGGVRTVTWRHGTTNYPQFLVSFQLLPNPSDPSPAPDLALVDPRSMPTSINGAPLVFSSGTSNYTPLFLPRNADETLAIPGGPPFFLILDARDPGDRVYLLGDDISVEDEEAFWLLTMEKQYGSSPGLTVHSIIPLPTIHATSETQRIKVSPDGRWIVATFSDGGPGYMLLHVPQKGAVLGTPEIVAGLRTGGPNLGTTGFRGWEFWAGSNRQWQRAEEAYTQTQRGQDALTRAPQWPLPAIAGPAPLLSDQLMEPTSAAGWVGNSGASAEFIETSDGTLLLSIDTDTITIWRIDPHLIFAPTDAHNSPAPWLFVGALPSEGNQRQRVSWTTPDGVFHLGDTGNWA